MKKIIIFIIIILSIVASMSYLYTNYKISYNNYKKVNEQYEYYYQKEIYGRDVASIINKVINNNKSYNVERDIKGRYIDNQENSINMDIKMLDNDATYDIEQIDNNGIEKFVLYYGEIKFKCTQIEYHANTKLVKYILFEQITQ